MIKIFGNQAMILISQSLNMLRTSDFAFLKQILWYVNAISIENIFLKLCVEQYAQNTDIKLCMAPSLYKLTNYWENTD